MYLEMKAIRAKTTTEMEREEDWGCRGNSRQGFKYDKFRRQQ